jgi:S-phase kinase-associated protein 1
MSNFFNNQDGSATGLDDTVSDATGVNGTAKRKATRESDKEVRDIISPEKVVASSSTKASRSSAKSLDREDDIMGLDDPAEEGPDTLFLISGDGTRVEVDRKIAIACELVKTMSEGDKEARDIHVPEVKTGDTLRKVIRFLEHHHKTPYKTIDTPIKSCDMVHITSDWDADYVDVDNDTLFDLIVAANYLHLEWLLDLTCAKVGSMIKGKTAEQIRATFNIVNDFSKEEEEQLKKESTWAEEAVQ